MTNEDTKYEIRDTNSEPSLLVSRISTLVSRMMALSVAYQQERPNVDGGDGGDLSTKRHCLLTSISTQTSQEIGELLEQDINHNDISSLYSLYIDHVLKKMRLSHSRQSRTGKKGWLVSLSDVIRWAHSYGLDPKIITGLNTDPHSTKVTTVTTVTPSPHPRFSRVCCERRRVG